jgi:uncharacterized membrane protein YsdA (DUF1294 family)
MESVRSRRRRPVVFHGTLSLALVMVLTAALWHAISGTWHWLPWAGAWLAAINLVVLGYYGYDKWQAARGGRRVPEVVLHGLALVGGSVGAFAGMQLFRHKTVKGSFRLVFWTIVVVQLGLAACLIHHAWRHRNAG